jgi:transposase
MRPRIEIPLYEDIKCIETLQNEGSNLKEMAQYYGVSPHTISRRIQQMKNMGD